MRKIKLLCLMGCIALSLSACGDKNDSGNRSTASKTNSSEEQEEMFVETIKEVPEGFMVEGEQIQELEQDQIGIYTLEDLQSIPEHSEERYVLMADIDCAGAEVNIEGFRGIFDGNYHQLKNLGSPLFSRISRGVVEDLAIIDSKADTAGIASNFWWGSIRNCYVTGEIGKNNEETYGVGGIVGAMKAESCSVKFCYNTADVYGKSSTGGIVGSIEFEGNDSVPVNIAYCENYGNVTGEGSATGGICGNVNMHTNLADYNGSFCFDRVINYGMISAVTDSDDGESGAGGIIGKAKLQTSARDIYLFLVVDNSANYGRIEKSEDGKVYLGGLCGQAMNLNNSNTQATIQFGNCLNASVSDTPLIGEIDPENGVISFEKNINLSAKTKNPIYQVIQQNSAEECANVTDCYYLDYDNEESTDQEATGLSKKEMQNMDNFEDFSYNVWRMSEDANNGYPYVRDYKEYADKIFD